MPLEERLNEARRRRAELIEGVRQLEADLAHAEPGAAGAYRDAARNAREREQQLELELARVEGEVRWWERRTATLRAAWTKRVVCQLRPRRFGGVFAFLAVMGGSLGIAAASLGGWSVGPTPSDWERFLERTCCVPPTGDAPQARIRYVPQGDAARFNRHDVAPPDRPFPCGWPP